MSWKKVFALLFIITGIIYFVYSLFCFYSAFASDCGLGLFFCFWTGLPFLMVGFYKLRIGAKLLKGDLTRLKLMIVLVGILDALSSYFWPLWIAWWKPSIVVIYVMFFYGLPLMYLKKQ